MNIDRLLEDRRVQFWGLQLLGWGGWGVLFYISATIWGATDFYLDYMPLAALVGLLLSLVMWQIYRFTWDSAIRHRIAAVLVAPFLAAVTWRFSRITIFGQMSQEKVKEHMFPFEGIDRLFSDWQGITQAWMVMLCWTGLYFGIKYYQLLQDERQRGLKTETMAHEAQLKMLRYQLNPHFLFNTLNAISTLILDKENKMANTMVTRLSHFLRYSLDNDPMQRVSLAQEIDALKLYLDIEKVRFAERLRLCFEIEPAAEKALIPSLLLQPLVENAIKYAVAHSVNGGAIRIAARVFAGELLLEVADDGPGLEHTNGNNSSRRGVGLANTRERLNELYGTNQSFQLSKTDPHGLTISIRLPFQQEQVAA